MTMVSSAQPEMIQGAFVELNALRVGTGMEITCMAEDPFNDTIRMVIGTRDRLVQVWSIDSNAQMRTVFSVQLDKTVPKAVAFTEHSGNVHVFGLYDGDV
jgi:hypothetical protein